MNCLSFIRTVRTLQGYDPVKYQVILGGILRIHTEIPVTDKLETLCRLCLCKCRLNETVIHNGQGIWIQIDAAILIVYTLFLIYNIFIKSYFPSSTIFS